MTSRYRVNCPGMGHSQWKRTLLRVVALFGVAALAGMTGCKGFFVPVCQENNTCPTTTTTATTATTTTTTTAATARTTTPTTSALSFIYTANPSSGAIQASSVSAGKITAVGKSYSPPDSAMTAISATPNDDRIFVATAAGPIYAYSIAAGEILRPANAGGAVASVPSATWMVTDRSGRLLFVASSGSSVLQTFQTNVSNNRLTPAASGPVQLDASDPTQIAITPDNRHLFVALGSGGVDEFMLNAAGGAVAHRVHLAPLRPGTTADNAIASGSQSKFIYIAESGAGIRVLKIDGDGSLTEAPGSPFASNTASPSSLVVDAANHALYAAYPASKLIAGYAIESDGELTPVSTMPFSPDGSPTALSLDATGTHLLAISHGGESNLQMFNFDSKTPGRLIAAAGATARATPAIH